MAEKLSDIKIWHVCGNDTKRMLSQLEAFIADPAHAGYTYIEHSINYLTPKKISPPGKSPGELYWVEITMLYKE